MEILAKGVKKTVNIGDTILLTTGKMATVTGQIDSRAIIAKTDSGELGVFGAADIVDIIVMVVRELGLVDKFVSWLKKILSLRSE